MTRQGFTLIEIVLSALVTMIAMTVTTSSLIDFIKNRHTAQNMSELIITGDGIINLLTHDLQWGEEGGWNMTVFPPAFEMYNPDLISYRLLNGNLYRNHELINNSNIRVDTFYIAKAAHNLIPLWRIRLELAHKTKLIGGNEVTYQKQSSISSRLNEIGGEL